MLERIAAMLRPCLSRRYWEKSYPVRANGRPMRISWTRAAHSPSGIVAIEQFRNG
jgi:hypothetical protein